MLNSAPGGSRLLNGSREIRSEVGIGYSIDTPSVYYSFSKQSVCRGEWQSPSFHSFAWAVRNSQQPWMMENGTATRLSRCST